MAESAWDGRRANTATIKFGKGYEAPWLVLSGSISDMRGDLVEAMGWDAGSVSGHTLVQLIALASAEVTAGHLVASNLGGRVVKDSEPPKAGPVKAEPAEAEGSADGGILDALAEAATLNDLKKIWSQQSAAINGSADLKAAFAAAKKRIEKGN